MRTGLRSDDGLSRLFVSRPPAPFIARSLAISAFLIVKIGDLFSLFLLERFRVLQRRRHLARLLRAPNSCQARKLQTKRVPLLHLADRCGGDDRSGCPITDQLGAR